MKYLDTFWRKDLDFNRKKDLTTSYFKKTLKSTEKLFFYIKFMIMKLYYTK